MVCQKLNVLSFADKKQSRRSAIMTLGAFLMTYFTLRKCSFGHLRRSMRMSASVDADDKSREYEEEKRWGERGKREVRAPFFAFATRSDANAICEYL